MKTKGHIHLHLMWIAAVILIIVFRARYVNKPASQSDNYSRQFALPNKLDLTQFKNLYLNGTLSRDELKTMVYGAIDTLHAINKAKADAFFIAMDSMSSSEKYDSLNNFFTNVTEQHDDAAAFLQWFQTEGIKYFSEGKNKDELNAFFHSIYNPDMKSVFMAGKR